MSVKIVRNHTSSDVPVTFGGTDYLFPPGDTTVAADLADYAQSQKGSQRDPGAGGAMRPCLTIVHPAVEEKDAVKEARAAGVKEGDLAARAEITPLLQSAADRIKELEAELARRPAAPPAADPSALETAATPPAAPAPEQPAAPPAGEGQPN